MIEPRLEAAAARVVVEAEEVHLGDVDVASSGAHELGVHRRLRRLIRDRHVLTPGVARQRLRPHLPADLVEIELQPVHGRRLGSPVERIPERLLDPIEVREPGVRPHIALAKRVGRLGRIRMEAEPVHERCGTPTCAVPASERLEEAHRRGGDVARGAGIIVAARREPDTDHRDRRIDRLEGVVRGREVRTGGCGRDVHATASELRSEKGRLVRLVHDGELPDLRVSRCHTRQPGCERLWRAEASLELTRRIWIDREDDADSRSGCVPHSRVEASSRVDVGRSARTEADGEDRLPEPERRHLREVRLAPVDEELRGVVVRADPCRAGALG